MLGCPIVQVIGRWYSATRHRAPMTPRQRNSLIWRLVKACLAAELLYCVFELLIFDMVFFSVHFSVVPPFEFVTYVFVGWCDCLI